MPKYKVNMARTTWLVAKVEADNEEEALRQAYEVTPPFSAQEGGWGSFGKWSADADEWMPIDEFYAAHGEKYSPKQHGRVVEMVEMVEGDDTDEED